MRRSWKVLAICSAVAVGLPLVGNAVGAHIQDAGAAAPVTGSLKAGPARTVGMKSLAPTGSAVRSNHAALLRNGKETGSNLPSQPSAGLKPGAAAPAVGTELSEQLIVANGFDGVNFANAKCGGCDPPDANVAVE